MADGDQQLHAVGSIGSSDVEDEIVEVWQNFCLGVCKSASHANNSFLVFLVVGRVKIGLQLGFDALEVPFIVVSSRGFLIARMKAHL